MLNHKLFDPTEDEELYEAVLQFNELYVATPLEITSKTYYQLWLDSGKRLPLYVWKTFMQDKRIREWYSAELELALDANMQKLAKESGNNRSTAAQQALSNFLRYKNDQTENIDNRIFIYTHLPLTTTEEKLANVKVIKNIPKEIGDSISSYEGSAKNK
jgi:predicted transcriptional regulator